MTRIAQKTKAAMLKLNKVLVLVHEIEARLEEISMLENEKDFSKAVLIDAGADGRYLRARDAQTGRPVTPAKKSDRQQCSDDWVDVKKLLKKGKQS